MTYYYDSSLDYPIPPHETWDIQDSSKVGDYIECPRKYFFKHVLGWSLDRPNIHLIFGSAWHKALAYMLKVDFDDIKTAYREHFLPYYRQYISPDEDEIYFPKIPSRAYLALAAYHKKYQERMREYTPVKLNGVAMIEIGGTVNLTDEIIIAFKMDSIMNSPKGIVSLEHKTGSSTYGWSHQWYLAIAVGTYSHALYCLYKPHEIGGILISGTFFKKVKGNAKKEAELLDSENFSGYFDFLEIPIFKTPDNMNVWLNNTIYWLDNIKEDFKILSNCSESDMILNCFVQRSPNCSSWSGCDYLDYCIAWNNPLKHCEKPPIGMKIDFWNPLEEEVEVKLDIKPEGG